MRSPYIANHINIILAALCKLHSLYVDYNVVAVFKYFIKRLLKFKKCFFVHNIIRIYIFTFKKKIFSFNRRNIYNFSQAVLCYVPQWLWNMWEGGLINALVMGMNHGLDHEDNIQKKKSMLMVYLMQYRKVNLFIYL